jgi:hypothetical protein
VGIYEKTLLNTGLEINNKKQDYKMSSACVGWVLMQGERVNEVYEGKGVYEGDGLHIQI